MTRPSYDSGFSTEELTDVFSPQSTVTAMLEFEAALVLALADTGIAPREEAEAVAAACWEGVGDPEGILASTWETGTPVIALREAVDAGEWFHHGATTQDVIDSGQMIQARRALDVLDGILQSVARRLRDLTAAHRDQPQMGRTFLQDARPTTFGFRTATWLSVVLDHIEELRSQRSGIPVQLGGPVGTAEAYGEVGAQVVEALAQRLGLRAPETAWHSDRAIVLSLAQSAERMARSFAKIGSDIALLSSSAIAEVIVRAGHSSSMPGKQNPIDSIRAVAAAAGCSGAVGMLTAAPHHELDRGVGGWHVEWLALPLALQTAGAAAEAIDTCLGSLEVDGDTMGTGIEASTPMHQIDRILTRCDEVLDG